MLIPGEPRECAAGFGLRSGRDVKHPARRQRGRDLGCYHEVTWPIEPAKPPPDIRVAPHAAAEQAEMPSDAAAYRGERTEAMHV